MALTAEQRSQRMAQLDTLRERVAGCFLQVEDEALLEAQLRRYRIRVVLGDRVTVAVSPYDLSKGRIVFRHK